MGKCVVGVVLRQVESVFLPGLYDRVAAQLNRAAMAHVILDDIVLSIERRAERARELTLKRLEQQRLAEEQRHALVRFATLCIIHGRHIPHPHHEPGTIAVYCKVRAWRCSDWSCLGRRLRPCCVGGCIGCTLRVSLALHERWLCGCFWRWRGGGDISVVDAGVCSGWAV